MKLGELKTAIRSMKGNPLIATTLPDGRTAWVATMKQGLLEMLDTSYEHKGSETGLSLNDGKITTVGEIVDLTIDGKKVTPTVQLTVDLSDPQPLVIDLDPPKVLTLDLDI